MASKLLLFAPCGIRMYLPLLFRARKDYRMEKKKKLKNCKHCGQQIAKSAKKCPHCGGKNKKPIYKRVWFIVLIVLIIGIVFLGGGEEDLSNVEYKSYTVDKMMEDLDENAVTASEKYNDQYVEITGKLNSIDSDGTYIDLLPVNDEWAFIGAMCYIQDDEQLETVKNMAIGDTVTIKGKVTDVGETLGYWVDIIEIE